MIKVTNILWDTDTPEEAAGLPAEIEIPERVTEVTETADLEDSISEYISDLTDFCHKGFSLTFEKTIRLAKPIADMIRKYLTEEPACAEECLGEDECISTTAHFPNGYEMEIKCCGVQWKDSTDENESNCAWTEAVLFHNGHQVAYTEPSDEFEGDWELIDDMGNTYIVHVVAG